MTRSPIALAALATLAVPGLDVVATRPPVRTTTDFQTAGVLDARGRHWVVRMPRTAAAGASLEGEVALLERLLERIDAHALPFEVERPAGFAKLSEGGRAMVCRELPGRPAAPDDFDADAGLAEHLAAALAALHGLDADIVGDAGLPVYDMATYRRRRLSEVDEASRTGDVPPELVNRWEEALEADDLWPSTTAVVHGDLDAELVRVADGRVTALMNFAEAHVGDPAEDFAWLISSAEPETLDLVQHAYDSRGGSPADPFLLDRAQLTSELLLTRWLMFGVRSHDEAVVADARRMLRELATDVAAAPPIGSGTRAALAEEDPADGDEDAVLGEDDWDEESWDEESWDEDDPDVDADDADDAEGDDRSEDPSRAAEDDVLDVAAAELDDEAWPAYDVHPGETPGRPGVPEPTAATADLSDEYERWSREGREF